MRPTSLPEVRRSIRDLADAERAAGVARFFKTGPDLIHKAVGWMLREAGKRDPAVLRGFLDAHAVSMPRVALRYAIERFGEPERRRYLALRAG